MEEVVPSAEEPEHISLNKENVTYSQESLEWEEQSDVDLRQLVRSPHMPTTPSLLLTQQHPSSGSSSVLSRPRRSTRKKRALAPSTASKPPSSMSDFPSSSKKPGGIAKRLDSKYSPGREIDGLLKLLPSAVGNGELGVEDVAELPTQVKGNLIRTDTYPPSTSLPGKGRRRKRKGDVVDDSAALSENGRVAGAPRNHVRRRPRSADGAAPKRGPLMESLPSIDCSAEFEALLKQLDAPGKARRPLGPSRTNVNPRGTSSSLTFSQPGGGVKQSAMVLSQSSAVQRKATCASSAHVPLPPPSAIVPAIQVHSSEKMLERQQAAPTRPHSIPTGPVVSTRQTSSGTTQPSDFGNDIEFSEEDLKVIDAACIASVGPKPDRAQESGVVPLPVNTNRSLNGGPSADNEHVHLPSALVNQAQRNSVDSRTDEFDDFLVSSRDLELIDRQIATRTSKSAFKKDDVGTLEHRRRLPSDVHAQDEFNAFPLSSVDLDTIERQIALRNIKSTTTCTNDEVASSKQQSSPPVGRPTKDEFDYLPMSSLDLEAIEQQIENRNSTHTTRTDHIRAEEIRPRSPSDLPLKDEFNDFPVSSKALELIDRQVVVRNTVSMATKENVGALEHRSRPASDVPAKDEFDAFPVSCIDLDTTERRMAIRNKPSIDEFGVFPLEDVDFDALDMQIEARNRHQAKDEFDDLPDVTLDFDALDKQIAERSTIVAVMSTEWVKGIPAPVIPVFNAQCPSFDPKAAFVSFSRYKVLGVSDDASTYTKVLEVKSWVLSMNKTDDEWSIHHVASSEGAFPPPHYPSVPPDGVIVLRGEWYHTLVHDGDIIHLCSLSGRYLTDVSALPVILNTCPPQGSDRNDDLVLIVHPELLVPPTVISEAVSCSRRAVLRARMGSSGLTSKSALFGTMRHELFGECMTSRDFSVDSSRKLVRRIVRENAESLVSCGVNDEEAQKEIMRAIPQIKQFAAHSTSFGATSLLKQTTIFPSGRPVERRASRIVGHGGQPDISFMADSVEAVEESVICPELGLKGSVDVTVSASTALYSKPSGIASSPASRQLMGIELKTGHNQNPQNAHMAQLALYTVMLKIRHCNDHMGESVDCVNPVVPANGGVLLYLNNQSYRMIHVSPILSEVRSLIGQRNVVASEIHRSARPRGIKLSYGKGDFESSSADRRVELLPAPPALLPDVLPLAKSCARCYMKRECMLYAAAENVFPSNVPDKGLERSHGNLLRHFTGHLSEDDLVYFRQWDRLIDLEADYSTRFIGESWLASAQEQEKATGKCISHLIFDEIASMMRNDPVPGITQHAQSSLIVLRRGIDSPLKAPLSRLNFETGSYVVVSLDGTLFDLSYQQRGGKNSKPRRIIRHQLHVIRGVVESIDDAMVGIRASQREWGHLVRLVTEHQKMATSNKLHAPLLFRVDKDEASTGVGTLRQNLVNLFTKDIDSVETGTPNPNASLGISAPSSQRSNHLSWLRDAVVRMVSPTFDMSQCSSLLKPELSVLCDASTSRALAAEFSELNVDQRRAVEKIFCMKDYSLLQGLPGTGKTSTISFVARLLAAHGRRVLITSYTHAAVDNLMLKLIDKGMAVRNSAHPRSRIARLGRKSVCHQDVHTILVETLAAELEEDSIIGVRNPVAPSAESLSSIISSTQIVGASALSVPRSPLLIGQHFDVVIVDEAGQISQPAILGALMAANTFVLVGDHMQLPPLVASPIAENGGYGVSMLKRLADRFPDIVAQLTLQYRMNAEICQLSNDIIYEGKLRCADDVVGKQFLNLPSYLQTLNGAASGKSNPGFEWLASIVNPRRPVIFANTDSIEALATQSKVPTGSETHSGRERQIVGLERALGKNGKGNIVNYIEASIIRRVIESLIACGLEPSKIGLICPFRSQVQFIEKNPLFGAWKASGLEISTIDRYQGRDKPVIIISFVRSNAGGNAGRLLEDFRRLNVAVTRAKQKLLLVGSYSTLHRGSSVLRPLLENMRNRNQVLLLPKNAFS